MSETFQQKLVNEARAFVTAPVYPFLQKDWAAKMWIFAVLSYVPILNVIIARGWRMDYIRRLGWREDRALPAPRDWPTFLKNGILLWLSTGVFLLVPAVVLTIFGLDGLLDLWNDVMGLLSLLSGYFLLGALPTDEFLRLLWAFVLEELAATAIVFLVENIWLIIYIPIYRIGMIRFALTGNLFRSHLAVKKNLRFLFRNFVDILLMYAFNIFNVGLVLIVNVVLTATVVGVPLIPILLFFMPYWNSGYEYGLLARIMVEQEQLVLGRAEAVQPAAEAVLGLAAPQTALALATVPAEEAPPPAAIALAMTAEGSAEASCPACAAPNASGYRFCTSCGSPLAQA